MAPFAITRTDEPPSTVTASENHRPATIVRDASRGVLYELLVLVRPNSCPADHRGERSGLIDIRYPPLGALKSVLTGLRADGLPP